MKIKSGATGEMVTYRNGMFVSTLSGNYKSSGLFGDEIRLDVSCMESKFEKIKNCTLLHCPFQVGDEVEIHTYEHGIEQCTIDVTEEADHWNRDQSLLGYSVIHANPSLRDAPEYKP